MKKVKMFIKYSCPYCREALRWMDDLFAENEKYRSLDISIIDENEHPAISDAHDYYYVPTYYVGDNKLHEGAASMEKIRKVFDAALE